jgi:hypothetical protein
MAELSNPWKDSTKTEKTEAQKIDEWVEDVFISGTRFEDIQRLVEANAMAIDALGETIDKLAQEIRVLVRGLMLASQPLSSGPTKTRWLTTRQAYDMLPAPGLSYDRFRRLTPAQLAKRFNIEANPAKRVIGSNDSQWLRFLGGHDETTD